MGLVSQLEELLIFDLMEASLTKKKVIFMNYASLYISQIQCYFQYNSKGFPNFSETKRTGGGKKTYTTGNIPLRVHLYPSLDDIDIDRISLLSLDRYKYR